MQNNVNENLMRFLRACPSVYHVTAELKRQLRENGFTALEETQAWDLKPGGKYFVSRNNSSLISFVLPGGEPACFRVVASHSDSPCFKLKPGPAVPAEGGLLKLNVEKYGGAIESSWFDRPLSLAGRVLLDLGDRLEERLVAFDRDLLLIPSLAIHFTRGSEPGKGINVQTDMLPVLGSGKDTELLWKRLAEELSVEPGQLLSADLFLCNRAAPTLWGAEREFLSAPKLDDLECCFCSFLGLLNAQPSDDGRVAVHCVFDNEEVGSRSLQGADSTFLSDTLSRICPDAAALRRMLAGSFLISADNAHAVHPNYAQMSDPVNRPALNRGVVIKYQAGQRYATDAVSAAVVKKLCLRHGIPFQEFTNRSDLAGGSTLGNLSVAHVPLRTADIGLPQLAMHSCFETAGAADPEALVRLCEVFYGETLPAVDLAV